MKSVIVIDGRLGELEPLSWNNFVNVEATGTGFSSSEAERKARLEAVECLAQALILQG
ncbi:MAG: hypothetical protein IIA55_16480 [Gemmatimonadetes bacterium]|nr:hypothetical protein [Gemmatimonadota bacterium]